MLEEGEKRKSSEDVSVKDVEAAKENQQPPVGVFEVFKYATGYEKLLLFTGILSALLGGTVFPITLIVFSDLMNELVMYDKNITSSASQSNLTEPEFFELVGTEDIMSKVNYTASLVLATALLNLSLLYILVATFNYAAEKQIFRMRKAYLDCIINKPISWFDMHQASDFSSRITEDINKLHEGIGEKVGMGIFLITNSFLALLVSLYYGWKLTLVCLSTFPLMVISTAVIARAQTSLAKQEVDEYARAGSVVEEALSAIRTVIAFGGEKTEVERYQENLSVAKKSAIKRSFITAFGLGIMWLILYSTFALGFWYGINLVIEGNYPEDPNAYNTESIMVIMFGILFGAINVGQSSPYIEAFNIGRAAAYNIFKTIDEGDNCPPKIAEKKDLEDFKGQIDFRNVSFSYPSRSTVNVLENVSFTVNPGESVALVGTSGSGKSTCIQLLLKFYDPSSGEILIDGFDAQHINSDWIYNNVGYVKQEPVLFTTTIEENIRYGKPNASLSEIVRASKEAMAHEFINNFPEGYKTLVGDRGVQLSGGQKQRIAIARIILRNPKILLLDEATSALDKQNEVLIQHALNKASYGRTTITVAHRLSTIQHANKIIVMKDGRIVETGTHGELMKIRNHYTSLIAAQMTESRQTLKSESEELMDFTDSCMKSIQDLNGVVDAHSSLRLSRTSSLTESIKSHHSRAEIGADLNNDDDAEEIPFVSMKELMIFARPEWHYILFGCIGSFFVGCTYPVYAIGFGEVLASLSFDDPEKAQEDAKFIGLLFFGLAVVACVATIIQSMMFSISGELFTERIRRTTFHSMLKQDLGWFDDSKNSVGVLCAKLSADAATVHGGTGGRIGTVFQVVVTLVFGVIVALVINWKLGLSALPFVPLMFIASQLEQRIFGGQTVTEVKALQQAGKIAHEAIDNIKIVRSLRIEEEFMKAYTKALYDPHVKTLKKCHLRGIIMGSSQALPLLTYCPIMFYGGYLVVNEGMPFENMFKVGESLIMGTLMVGQAIAFAPNFSKAKMAAGRVFQIIKRTPEIDCAAEGLKRKDNGEIQSIQFSNVEFRYPSRPAIPVLEDFSLTINKGETVALVGQSGSGKSTVVNILERYYNWKQGSISIDDLNLSLMNVPEVRSLFGLVSQEPVLFNRTIFENISYGDNTKQFSIKDVHQAAQQANIHDFISSLPEGYDTLPGSKGGCLSGGQKQRIAIARALIRNPQILLLDEATSALDTENEKIVQETLDKVQENRTNLVIAHRLSTIRNADKIVVIDSGRVVEMGTHKELMNNREYYYRLHQT